MGNKKHGALIFPGKVLRLSFSVLVLSLAFFIDRDAGFSYVGASALFLGKV